MFITNESISTFKNSTQVYINIEAIYIRVSITDALFPLPYGLILAAVGVLEIDAVIRIIAKT